MSKMAEYVCKCALFILTEVGWTAKTLQDEEELLDGPVCVSSSCSKILRVTCGRLEDSRGRNDGSAGMGDAEYKMNGSCFEPGLQRAG